MAMTCHCYPGTAKVVDVAALTGMSSLKVTNPDRVTCNLHRHLHGQNTVQVNGVGRIRTAGRSMGSALDQLIGCEVSTCLIRQRVGLQLNFRAPCRPQHDT